MIRPLRAGLTAAALLALTVPSQAQNFSPDAQLIYNSVKAAYDINRVCRSEPTLREAMRRVVTRLVDQGRLPENPRRQAREAGEYIAFNCGNLS